MEMQHQLSSCFLCRIMAKSLKPRMWLKNTSNPRNEILIKCGNEFASGVLLSTLLGTLRGWLLYVKHLLHRTALDPCQGYMLWSIIQRLYFDMLMTLLKGLCLSLEYYCVAKERSRSETQIKKRSQTQRSNPYNLISDKTQNIHCPWNLLEIIYISFYHRLQF